MNPQLVVLLVVLAFVAALASAADGALFSLSRDVRRRLGESKGWVASGLLSLLAKPDDTLFNLELLSELSIAGLAIGITLIVIEQVVWSEGVLALLLIPFFLICSFILPRAVAARFPDRVSRLVVVPLRILFFVLFPLSWLLQRIRDAFLRFFHLPARDARHLDEKSFRRLVDMSGREGDLGKRELELIHNVLEFDDKSVDEVMTPRTEIVGFSIETSVSEILEGIRKQRFARVPIYRSNLDNIIGILYTKKLLDLKVRPLDSQIDLEALLHPVHYVPTTQKLDLLFSEFKAKHSHMAVVVDEYGGVSGLVTMDDVLSELFGKILDEHDVPEPEYVAVGEGVYRVQAGMELEDLEKLFGIDLPDHEDLNTVGGFLMDRFETLPSVGDSLVVNGLRFTVERVEGTRLLDIQVARDDSEGERESEEGDR